MSKLSWEAPCNILREAEAIVNARSPYVDREEWRITKQHHAAWCEPITYALQALPTGSRVLDIGPGYGALAATAALLGHEVDAVELFLDALPWPGVRWMRGDACDAAVFVAGRVLYDFAIMAEVLEHLTTDPAEAFANIATALKPGAACMGSTPLPGVWPGPEPCSGVLPPWTPEHTAEDRHVRLYTPADTQALLAAAGFAVLEIEAIGSRYLWRAKKELTA